MTAEDFRRIALSLPEASENAHMNHPDFRVHGKVFATLAYPNTHWAMVKLTPERQQEFLRLSPATFQPASGAWGRQGSTQVRLESADEILVQEALTCAWRHTVQKATAKRPRKPSHPDRS